MSFKGLVLIDGCTIGHIKNNLHKDRLANDLIPLSKEGYKFSFLLILLERAVSFATKPEKMEDLILELKKDYDVLQSFFGSTSAIYEPKDGIGEMLHILMEHDYSLADTAESQLPNRLDIILTYSRLENKYQLSGKEYFESAKQIIDKALSLGLAKNDPAIVTCIAALYQCEGARGILKSKADKDEMSNANNSMMDIMILQRIGTVRNLIESFGHKEMDLIFRTEDASLQNFYSNVRVNLTKGTDADGTDGIIDYKYIIKNYEELFPYLFSKKENRIRELKTICELIGLTYPDNLSEQKS